MNNTVLLLPTDSNPPFCNLYRLSQCFEIISEIQCFATELDGINDDYQEQVNGSAEGSFAVALSRGYAGAAKPRLDQMKQVMAFLEGMVELLLDTLAGKDLHFGESPQVCALHPNNHLTMH